jgi:hypothetical protein
VKAQVVYLKLTGVIEIGEPTNVIHMLDIATAEKIGNDLLRMAKECKS